MTEEKLFAKGMSITFVDSLKDMSMVARLCWDNAGDMDYLFGREILLTEDLPNGGYLQLKRRKDKVRNGADFWNIHRPFFKEYYI